jgi:hypothetical protein
MCSVQYSPIWSNGPNDVNNLDRVSSHSQQISSCSSLHKPNGARYAGRSSLLFCICRMVWGMGKLIFLMPRPAAIFIDYGAASTVFVFLKNC